MSARNKRAVEAVHTQQMRGPERDDHAPPLLPARAGHEFRFMVTGRGPRAARLGPLLLLVAAGLASQAVQAGPPFLTDDPEPVDLRHWEAYVFSTYDRSSGATGIQGPALEFNLGAAPGLQLHLVVPWAWNRVRGSRTGSGWGDVELGFKVRLLKETASRPEVGIFPMAELPSGSASLGLGNGRAWFKIPLWIQKSWGPWTTYGGGGWAINHAPGQRDYPFGGWLLQRDVNERLTLGGEIFAQGADAVSGRGYTVANIGGYFNFRPGFSLLFSAGRSIHGQRHTVGYLGLYWTWGPAARRASLPHRRVRGMMGAFS